MTTVLDAVVRAVIECINDEIHRTDQETDGLRGEQRHKKIALKKMVVNESYIRGLSKAKAILIDQTGYKPTTERGKNE